MVVCKLGFALHNLIASHGVGQVLGMIATRGQSIVNAFSNGMARKASPMRGGGELMVGFNGKLETLLDAFLMLIKTRYLSHGMDMILELHSLYRHVLVRCSQP